MFKQARPALALALLLGLLAGCSSNQATETDPSTIEPEPTLDDGQGVRDSGVGLEEVDPMADVPRVFYFEFDSAVLDSQARSALLLHAQNLRNANSRVRLTGHADERGSREYNMALGERRANAVRDFLVLQGVSSSRIDAVSYGEERPAVSGSGESVWSRNRRVEIELN